MVFGSLTQTFTSTDAVKESLHKTFYEKGTRCLSALHGTIYIMFTFGAFRDGLIQRTLKRVGMKQLGGAAARRSVAVGPDLSNFLCNNNSATPPSLDRFMENSKDTNTQHYLQTVQTRDTLNLK